jgi:hypothetical protein
VTALDLRATLIRLIASLAWVPGTMANSPLLSTDELSPMTMCRQRTGKPAIPLCSKMI